MSESGNKSGLCDGLSNGAEDPQGLLISIAMLRRLRKEREALAISEYLRWGELCRMRVEFRNKARSCVESSEMLARWFGAQYIPEVNANEINMEEIERCEFKLKSLAAKQENEWPGEALAYLVANTFKDEHELKRKEFIKYLGTKLDLILADGDFSGAREFVEAHRSKAEAKGMMIPFDDEVGFRLVGYFTRCIKAKNIESMVKLFVEMGETIRISRDDLREVKDEDLADETLIAALGMQMNYYRESSPDHYRSIMKYFGEMGLNPEKK